MTPSSAPPSAPPSPSPSSKGGLKESLDVYVKAAQGKKATRLVVLDVRGLSAITDAFLICTGKSNRQVTAIAEHIQIDLKQQGIRPLSVEGLKEGHWVVMDYADVIIHVFYEPIRAIYDIEGLWADAKRITTESLRVPPAGENKPEPADEEA